MTDATKTLLKAIKNFNTEGLSELLFDNKSEVACNQRLCAAINKETSNYLARVEYTNKDDSVSRADLVMINRDNGKVVLCAEAKTLTAINVKYPTKGEKKKTNKDKPKEGYHPFFDNMKQNIVKQKFRGEKIAIMWVYGWSKFAEPKEKEKENEKKEMYFKEKYYSLRRRLKNEDELKEDDVKKEIKRIFKKLGLILIKPKPEILYAKDTHEGYKAYLIVTIGKVK